MPRSSTVPLTSEPYWTSVRGKCMWIKMIKMQICAHFFIRIIHMDVQNRDFPMKKYIINYSFKSSKVDGNRDIWNCMNLFLTVFFLKLFTLFKRHLF